MSINYKGKDKSIKDIFNINASIFDFGYDGRYLDISVAGGLSTDSFSIDLWQIINDIVNLFKEGEN